MKNRITLYKIAAGFVSFLFVYVLLYKVVPQYYSVYQVINEYNEASNQLAMEENWQEETVRLKRKINRLKNQILQTNQELPYSGMLSRPLQVLDSLAQNNHIRIKKVQTIAADSSKQYDFVTVLLSCEGTFFTTSNFVKQIENAGIVINVEGLNLKLASLFRKAIYTELKLVLLFKRYRH